MNEERFDVFVVETKVKVCRHGENYDTNEHMNGKTNKCDALRGSLS